MIPVIKIPMGSHRAPFLTNLCLARKLPDLIKAQLKLVNLEQKMFEKSIVHVSFLMSYYHYT